MPVCSHLRQIRFTRSEKDYCDDCVQTGGRWLHLRLCLECGHVGCCDSSPNKHATRHFQHTRHSLMRSIEPDEHWVWCYVDEFMPGEIGPEGFVPVV